MSSWGQGKVIDVFGQQVDPPVWGTPEADNIVPRRHVHDYHTTRFKVRGIGTRSPQYLTHNGTPHILTILVNYKDSAITVNNPKEAFNQFFNHTGSLQDFGNGNYRNYGSVSKYFNDISNGKFKPVFDVYGPVTLPQNMTYYGGVNENSGFDENPAALVSDALALVKDSINNVSIFDGNNDGYIDCVYIIYAGPGQNFGGGGNTVWAKTHYTSGMASMTYLKAIEAGADIIDTASTPLAMGTSQPSTEVMVAALQGTEYDTGLDLDKLIEISNYFQPYREECIKSGLLSTKVLGVDIKALKYQVPGGMLSNLISQLHQAGKDEKLQEVLEEVPRVRKDFGEPPLVTPSSQIVGTQAVMNVITGERYKMVPKESYKLVAGEFGRTVKPMDEEMLKKVLKGEKQMTDRPADHIPPQLEQFKEECKEWTQQPEDVLSYALFPQVAKDYFQYRDAQKSGIALKNADKENKAYPV